MWGRVRHGGCPCVNVIIVRHHLVGIFNFSVSVSQDLVLVDAILKTSEVHSLLESTGLLVFFKGFGGNEDGTWHFIVYLSVISIS